MKNRPKPWTIRDLTRLIRSRLESEENLQDVWIQGEISNFKHHTSGHMYFTLKDRTSRIRCVMFASYNRRIGFIPREGASVLARGSVSVYERDGQYQFYVTEMQPDGLGSLYLAFEELKKRLEAEGLFAAERKKRIPAFPRAIGVMTSPTGAAVRDILITLRRRMPAVPVLLCPVSVQGKQAAPSIVKALEQMNRMDEVDVIILGRGGGSLEELWAFNEESVARAIAASSIPVISAVGHETDFTIADFVADLRAATPTAAAELAAPNHLETRQRILYLQKRLHRGLTAQLQFKKERLNRIRRSSHLTYPKKHLLESAERLDRLADKLQYSMRSRLGSVRERWAGSTRTLHSFNPRREVQAARQRADGTRRELVRIMRSLCREKRMAWQSSIRQLDALSPLKVMQRGYSVTYDEKKERVIKSIRQVQPGDRVQVVLGDGELDCQVWAMRGESQ